MHIEKHTDENKNISVNVDKRFSENCDSPQTQLELNQCASQNYQQKEQKLKQIYQRLRDEIKGTNQEQKLIQAESAWQKFRNLDCEYVSAAYQGRLTEERIEHLESYLENIQR